MAVFRDSMPVFLVAKCMKTMRVWLQILPPKMGLPKSGMTVLRAAARARADRAMVADEMDAAAATREAAGEAAIASAFARAMAADKAHSDRRLVAVANAVALAEYVTNLFVSLTHRHSLHVDDIPCGEGRGDCAAHTHECMHACMHALPIWWTPFTTGALSSPAA